MDMQSRIELELRGKEAAAIKELNLDNCRATQIEGLTDDFVNLETLSLIAVGLTTLKGFPNLPNLRKLELSDNRISNGLNNLLGCTHLTHLNLSNNKIKDMEIIGPLAKLEHLSHLDLFSCEITSQATYREEIFKLLPNLKYLDNFDRENKEDEEDDEEYADGDDDEDDEDEEEGDDDEEDDGEFDEEEDEDLVVVKKSTKNGAATAEAEDEDEEDDDEDDEDDEDEEDDGPGLSYLQKSNLPDDEDDADFDEKKALEKVAKQEEESDESEGDDEDLDDEDLEAEECTEGGRKRKLEESE